MITNFDDSVNVNIDKSCGLPKVVDNYPKEISSCAERNNFTFVSVKPTYRFSVGG